jgi:uncharacterized membrane protein
VTAVPPPLERAISRVLFWGGVASIALAVIGLVLHFAIAGRGHAALELARLQHREATGVSPFVFRSVGEIADALVRTPPEPLALTATGLLLLLVTPVAGLAVAALGFARSGDGDYTAIAALVLALLVVSFFLAGAA